jgi:ABC-type sugar transport system ATPase subunit
MTTIRLRDVTKIYAGRAGAQVGTDDNQPLDRDAPVLALDQVNLTVLAGQTLAVVGPSGCGKSTLLRVVAGLETDYTGLVTYDSQDVKEIPPRDRYIGIVFQNYALYPHFKGRDNLAFFFVLHQVPDQETEARIQYTSEIMGIGFDELLKRKPGTYSGGEQQRVALGRAIARNPRLLLLDEPMSNLDAKLRSQTRVEIKRLLHRFRITTIYVTHNLEEAITLGDQLAVMRQGRIEQVGPYAALRRNPANTFVATFLDNPPMNLFPGAVVAGDQLYLDDCSIPLPQAASIWARPGRTVTVGVHAEVTHLHLPAGSLPYPTGFRLRGTVELVERDFVHRTQLVHLHTGRFAYAAIAPLAAPLQPGDEVEVILPTDQLYFFDSKNERRIG